MRPRDRCIASIEMEEPDRVPLVLELLPESLEKLLHFLGIAKVDETGRRIQGTGGRFERYLELVYRRLGVDIRITGCRLKGGYKSAKFDSGDYWRIKDRFGIEIMQGKSSHKAGEGYVGFPLQHIPLAEYVWPEPDVEDQARIKQLRQAMDEYCLLGGIEHLFERAWQLTGFEQFMVKMYQNTAFAEAVLSQLNEIRTQQAMLLAEEDIDVIMDGDDVGTQIGMMMSPTHWRRFLKPRYAEMVRRVKKKHNVYFQFHSDGYIEPIIPDIIETGFDILDPVQPECMDVVKLKESYGDKICFYGTMGIQKLLPFGSVGEVVHEVKSRIRTIGISGLILGPTHYVEPDVPPENVVALYDTARRHGRGTRIPKAST